MDKAAIIKALRDTAQSASNTAAGSVSGPVDLIASGMRSGGVAIPDEPMGGSKWMESKGLVRPVRDGAAKMAGETIGLLMPAMAASRLKVPKP